MIAGEVTAHDDLRRLDGQTGFVFAPFDTTRHPVLLIHPDRCQDISLPIGPTPDAGLAQDVQHDLSHLFPPQGPQPSSCSEDETYEQAFDTFKQALDSGKFTKLVLSHRTSVSLPDSFSPYAAFLRACQTHPDMMVSLVCTSQSGLWLGCTPELLLSGLGQRWKTVALAGTKTVGEKSWNDKNRREQLLVADYIANVLQPYADSIAQTRPATIQAGNVCHLRTLFTFNVRERNRIGSLLYDLFPTPAVCGLPKRQAFDFIARNEGYDRTWYSGFLGMKHTDRPTALYVNLRCMRLFDDAAWVYAGGGLLSESALPDEKAEIAHKMQTMLNLLH